MYMQNYFIFIILHRLFQNIFDQFSTDGFVPSILPILWGGSFNKEHTKATQENGSGDRQTFKNMSSPSSSSSSYSSIYSSSYPLSTLSSSSSTSSESKLAQNLSTVMTMEKKVGKTCDLLNKGNKRENKDRVGLKQQMKETKRMMNQDCRGCKSVPVEGIICIKDSRCGKPNGHVGRCKIKRT